METNWTYRNNKPMTQEHKESLKTILLNCIDNIEKVTEYHLESRTDVEEVPTEEIFWKRFRPGKRYMDLKISACIDGYYINSTEKEKNADTKTEREAHDINIISGLTLLENQCMNSLMDAYGAFLKMERCHPDEMREFVDAVHAIQDLLACRVVGRTYPKYWKNCSPKTGR